MVKHILRCVCVLISFNQITAAMLESTWPDPADGEACYKKLNGQTEFPAERVPAWDEHIHLLIQVHFTGAGMEYSGNLRNLCNAAFYFIEQGMGRVFESGLEDNQARVRDMLAPKLLEIEQGSTEQKLHAQAGVLVWMIKAHPMGKK